MTRWILLILLFVNTDLLAKVQSSEEWTHVFEKMADRNKSILASINYYSGDFDYDGKEDLLALYTLELLGGNHYSQHAALIKENSDSGYTIHRIELGNKTTQSVSYSYFSNGIFYFDTNYVKENDSFCCPTGIGVAFMVFFSGKLVLYDSKNNAEIALLRDIRTKLDNAEAKLWSEKSSFEQALCMLGQFIPYNSAFMHTQFSNIINQHFNGHKSNDYIRFYFMFLSYSEKINFLYKWIDAVDLIPNLLGQEGCDLELMKILSK